MPGGSTFGQELAELTDADVARGVRLVFLEFSEPRRNDTEPGRWRVEVVQRIYEPPPDTTAHKVRDTVSEYVANQVVGETWKVMTAQWCLVDPGRLDAAAGALESASDAAHNALIGSPVHELLIDLGTTPAVSEVFSAVASDVVGLPTDDVVARHATAIRVAGVVIGTAVGAPWLATACFHSLAKSYIAELLNEVLTATFASPADLEPPALEPTDLESPAPPEPADLEPADPAGSFW